MAGNDRFAGLKSALRSGGRRVAAAFARFRSADQSDTALQMPKKSQFIWHRVAAFFARFRSAGVGDSGLRMPKKSPARSMGKSPHIHATREQMEAQLAELGVKYTEDPKNLDTVEKIANIYERLEDWENCASYYDYAFSLGEGDGTLQRKAQAARDKLREQQITELPSEIAGDGNDAEGRKPQVQDLRHAAVDQQIAEVKERVGHRPTDLHAARHHIVAFFTRLRHLRRDDVKPWLASAAALLLLLFVVWKVGGRMSGEVWSYYTDEKGIRVDAEEGKARDVLWEEPVATHFAEQEIPGPSGSPAPGNLLTGRLEAAFSANGAMMALVRRDADGSNAEMYLSNWDGRSWSPPQPIKAINTGANERGPAFSRDGKYLYFSSDREGGLGGYDIYVARWNARQWGGVVALGETINTANDEQGPALSGDGRSLLFSSRRSDREDEDIYSALRKEVKTAGKGLPPVPAFEQAEPILGDLNSRADDIQAALTRRGDHVFLASNREQDKFGVYISRFVDGEAQKPEKVDLYISEGDVTDPAVRMDGFDLLFSSDQKLRQDDKGRDFRLFRSTTREVFGYTDRRVWEQFKELIGNIKWWLLLAIASLLALIYLLERWRDISSLYHKCLAGSAMAHLLSLLLGMVWLISSEIDSGSQEDLEEITINLNALTQEELAMESVPEEVEIIDHSEAVANAKAETEFNTPDLKPQEFTENVSVASSEVQEAVDIEISPVQAEFNEEAELPKTEDSQLIAELSETLLPDLQQPLLEENSKVNPAETQVDSSKDMFRPEPEDTAVAKSDVVPLEDTALEAPTEVSEVAGATQSNPSTTTQVSAVSQVRPEHIDQNPDVPLADEILQSALLSSLPDQVPVDSAQPILEEAGNEPGGAVADSSKDMFRPAAAEAGLETAPVSGEVAADSAAVNPADASEVGGGGLVAEASETAVRPSEVSGSGLEQLEPASSLESGSLPELALIDPGAPKLEEAGNEPGGAVADSSKDMFRPAAAEAGLETAPVSGEVAADSALGHPSSASDVAAAQHESAAGLVDARNGLEAGSSQLEPGVALDVAAASLGENALALNDPLLPGALESPGKGLDIGGLGDMIKKHRGKPSLDVIKQMGGSDGTEKAIGFAIEWLSKNQENDGRWDARKHGANHDYDVGATGLALLCYYGWGARHDRAGKYQNNVIKGINWLLKAQKSNGALAVRGQMYSHAIATIALCEAYGITRDPKIRPVAQKAIAYTISAQHPTRGGWRYIPGQDSDTSVTGWQFMALHSARMAGLKIPEHSFELARRWFESISGGKDGGLYGYQAPSKISRAMVPTGMFCRQLDLVPPVDPRMVESARFMKKYPMKTEAPDLYYVYYATLALYQHQGPVWDAWNARLKTTLPLIQRKDGAETGSWDLSSSMAKDGGRVISTTLATLSLEVYYRFLPMYGFRRGVASPATGQEGE